MAGGMGGEPLSTGDQLALVEKSVLLGSGKSISKSSPRNSIRQWRRGAQLCLGFAIRMHVLRSVTNWYKTLASGVAWAQSKHVCVLLGILSGT